MAKSKVLLLFLTIIAISCGGNELVDDTVINNQENQSANEQEGLELKSKVLFIKLELQKYKLFLIYFYSNMTISTQLNTRLFLKKL